MSEPLQKPQLCDITRNNQVTYFCLSPLVGAVGAAVLVYWTWGYWWDWSGLIHYEDAPYMTDSSG